MENNSLKFVGIWGIQNQNDWEDINAQIMKKKSITGCKVPMGMIQITPNRTLAFQLPDLIFNVQLNLQILVLSYIFPEFF